MPVARGHFARRNPAIIGEGSRKVNGAPARQASHEDGVTITDAATQIPLAEPDTGDRGASAASARPRDRSPAGALARAAALVMAAYVLSRVLGLAREMVLSHQFGTSRDLDAYRAAFNIPDLIFTLIAGGALGSAFIPTFTTYLARGERAEAWRLASAVMNLAFLGLDGLGDPRRPLRPLPGAPGRPRLHRRRGGNGPHRGPRAHHADLAGAGRALGHRHGHPQLLRALSDARPGPRGVQPGHHRRRRAAGAGDGSAGAGGRRCRGRRPPPGDPASGAPAALPQLTAPASDWDIPASARSAG